MLVLIAFLKILMVLIAYFLRNGFDSEHVVEPFMGSFSLWPRSAPYGFVDVYSLELEVQ